MRRKPKEDWTLGLNELHGGIKSREEEQECYPDMIRA